jgi:hypothetical protein
MILAASSALSCRTTLRSLFIARELSPGYRAASDKLREPAARRATAEERGGSSIKRVAMAPAVKEVTQGLLRAASSGWTSFALSRGRIAYNSCRNRLSPHIDHHVFERLHLF